MTWLSLSRAATNKFAACLLAAVTALAALPLSGGIINADIGALKLSDFTSYYSTHIRNNPLERTDASKYWAAGSDGTITRINAKENTNVLNDMAILYYEAAEYTDFILEFDYYRPAGNSSAYQGAAYAGFNGEAGKSWTEEDGGTIVWEKNGEGRYYGSYGLDAEVQKNGFCTGDILSDKSAGKWRHYVLTVKEGILTMSVDGTALEKSVQLGSWYDGGCIFIASNISGTSFKNITVNDGQVSDEPENPESDCYYSPDLEKSDPIPSNTEDYWKINNEDGSITRINSSNPGGEFKETAIYYFDDAVYRDFVLELDYFKPDDADSSFAFIGFDSTPGKGWDDLYSGTMFWQYGGQLRIRGSSSVNGEITDGWGTGNEIPDWREAKWRHFKLEVNGTSIRVWIDGLLKFQIDNLGDWYDGGRLFVASNYNGVAFKNMKVTSLNYDYTNDFTLFDSYFTENVKDNDLVSADAADYWTEHDGIYNRRIQEMGSNTSDSWNQSHYHLGNMAYLFFNGGYTEWDNYVFEMKYTHGTGAWGRIYIGFGASEPVSWRSENGGVVFFTDSGGSTNFEGNITSNGTINTSQFGLKLDGFDPNASHDFRLECIGGVITVFVDDIEIKTLVQADYMKGGRIFIASNSSGAEYSDIKITEIDAESASFEGYDEWFGGDIKTGSLEDVPEGTNWAYYNGKFTRVSEMSTSAQNNLDMAYLYFTERKYTNFKMEFDYKHGMTSWRRAPVGFGAELGKHYMQADGGVIGFAQPEGVVHFDGNVSENGKFTEYVWWAAYDDYGNNLTYISPYNPDDWHHMTLTVQDGYATMQFDEFGYIYEITLPSAYDGGYIYLCANSLAAQYKDIVIEDLDVEIDEDAQRGWQPDAEDSAFDFSFRKFDVDIAEWKYKDIIFG